jgi:hypothetical protein
VKIYTLTMRIEADDDRTPESIKAELYEATEGVEFAFDVTEIRGQA